MYKFKLIIFVLETLIKKYYSFIEWAIQLKPSPTKNS